jgi:hypothetical protein
MSIRRACDEFVQQFVKLPKFFSTPAQQAAESVLNG